MVQDTKQRAIRPEASGSRGQRGTMAMCPMAKMCKGMMEKPPSGLLLTFAGATVIVVGVLVLFEPRLLAWLIGAAFVMLGIMLLMMAGFVRRMGTQLRDM